MTLTALAQLSEAYHAAERSSSGTLLGFRGQKHIIQSDFAKLNKSSASVKRDTVATAAPPIRRVPAVFEKYHISKNSLIESFDVLWPNIKQDTN